MGNLAYCLPTCIREDCRTKGVIPSTSKAAFRERLTIDARASNLPEPSQALLTDVYPFGVHEFSNPLRGNPDGCVGCACRWDNLGKCQE